MGLVKTALDDLTYRINGLAMRAQSELKTGHRERVYQHRLAELVLNDGLSVETEKKVEVYVNDTLIGYMFLDLWIEQILIVECKAHTHQLTNEEAGQVITYLAATGAQAGMLYNFGRAKLEFKRILPPKHIQEWHKHLYRSIWTRPGKSLPPLDSLHPDSPVRFSVLSQPPQSVSIRLPTPVAGDASIPSSVENQPPPESASPTGNISSVSIRLSASPSVDHYTSSGVSLASGNRAVSLMRDSVRSTYGPEVLAGIGAFGGLYSAAALKGMSDPVLVASTDGVGTKVKLAAQARRYDSIGHDIVNHCVNDILVQGARPLFFLDYIASSKIEPETIACVVRGIAAACREAGCALLGGETAEMPGVYQPDEFDVAGTIVGIVDRANILPRSNLQAGDLLIGLRASGPHTNGYSLIRKIFADVPLETVFPELGLPLADALLTPHRSYLQLLITNLHLLKALAHLTGGGFIENIPRILPNDLGAVIHPNSWPVPPLFTLIQQRGSVTTDEMYRVFNMGIGMVAVTAPEHARAFQASIPEESFVIGELIAGERKVTLA